MPIPTSRTTEKGRISIDSLICNGCGLCVEVCKDFSLAIENGKAVESKHSVFGCIACGHCMAVCPRDAISVQGRHLSPADLFPVPQKADAASFEALLALFQRRRSIREFKDKSVERQVIDKVLHAAATAPMGIPPSDVHVLVLESKEQVLQFSKDYCEYLKSLRWMVSGWFLAMMRPFWGKVNTDMFRDFIRPLIAKYTESMDKGENVVMYDAPVGLYFYGSPYTDPADPLIAATYAMTAAESLGLGTCMLGAIHPFIQSGKGARTFREKYRIRFKSREGLFVIMGYPRIKFEKGIHRTFANIDHLS
ncbi:MAG TPA: nitroreductase family protein [Bacteroidales bacterium]|nr:nitroreductase family protein [Bacteroidales bacterium]